MILYGAYDKNEPKLKKLLRCAQLISFGKTTKEIAALCNVSDRGVENWKGELIRLTGSKNTEHMIATLIREKVIK